MSRATAINIIQKINGVIWLIRLMVNQYDYGALSLVLVSIPHLIILLVLYYGGQNLYNR